MSNLFKHIENLRSFGLPVIVSTNAFESDAPEEWDLIRSACSGFGVQSVVSNHLPRGGADANNIVPESTTVGLF
jgi:formate--tetrahydrofolate ligase